MEIKFKKPIIKKKKVTWKKINNKIEVERHQFNKDVITIYLTVLEGFAAEPICDTFALIEENMKNQTRKKKDGLVEKIKGKNAV